MTAKIVEWRALELPSFASSWASFAVIDPDQNGAIVMHEEGKPSRALLLDDVGAACKSVALQHRGGPLVLVIEMPFTGKNAHQAMGSGIRTGILPAYVAAYADARVEVVWVYPATWQGHLKRVAGLKGVPHPETGKIQPVERTVLKAAAVSSMPASQMLTPAFMAGRKDQKQAIADCCAIGRWWGDRK